MKGSNFVQHPQTESEGSYSPCRAIVIIDSIIQNMKNKLTEYECKGNSKAYIVRERKEIISKLFDAKHAVIPLLYSDILSVLNANMIDLLNRDPEIGLVIIELQVGKDLEKKGFITLKSRTNVQ